MLLTKIELHGFKSFAQKTTLQFRTPLTVVVGPNGAGKSNIADAVRWVLGEQSPKLLRGKKHEDVIFHGSSEKGQLGMAEVSLFLDNKNGRLPIEYPEVVISRRVYRDGHSEYLLNHSEVRLSDIVMMLAKAHFGQKSYAVVGQGMIEKIINLLPSDRKEFFDEAAGVKQYQMKRDQAVNKLIRTEENLHRINDLIAEVEPHLRSLKRQVSKLAKREKIVEKLQQLQVSYYGYMWQDITQQIVHLKDEHDRLSPERDSLEQQEQVLRKKLQTFASEKDSAEVYRTLRSEYEHIMLQKNALLKEQTLLEGEREREAVQSGQKELSWLRSRSQVVERDIASLTSELAHVSAKKDTVRSDLDQRISHQKELIASFKDKEYKFLKAKEEAVQGHSVTLPAIRERLDIIYRRQETFIEKLFQTNDLTEFKKVKNEARDITLQLADLMDFLASKAGTHGESYVRHLEEDLKQFMTSRDNLVNEISECKVSLSSLEERHKILSEQKNQKQLECDGFVREIQRAESQGKGETASIKQLNRQHQDIQKRITDLDTKLSSAKEKLDSFNDHEQQKKNQMITLQNDIEVRQRNKARLQNELNDIQISMARLETRREDFAREIQAEIPDLAAATMKASGFNRPVLEEVRNEIQQLKKQLELIGGIDPEIVREHDETNQRFEFLRAQFADLNKAVADLEKVIDVLDATIKKHFHASFREINKNFDRYFQILFGGGHAKLSLVSEASEEEDTKETGDEAVVFATGIFKKKQKVVSGIQIVANPPGKKLRDVALLSGGEKSLTAISLIAAIIASNPPPFVFLDEVEASLDEANSERFTRIIADLSKRTQFVIISHNRATMKEAGVLYGVTMNPDGTSRLLSVELKDINDKMIGRKVV